MPLADQENNRPGPLQCNLRFFWLCHATLGLIGELLLGRFRAAIPRLAELSRRAPSARCRHGWDRMPGEFMSESPYFAEDLIIRLSGALLHKRPNLHMEPVDLGGRVRPRID